MPEEVIVLTRVEFEAGRKVICHYRPRCYGKGGSFMQPEKLAEVRSWLKKAAADLRGSDIDLAASPPFIEDMLFHCQQAGLRKP